MRRWIVAVAFVLGGCDDLKERVTPEPGAAVDGERATEDLFESPPSSGPVGLKPGKYRIVSVGATVTRRTARGLAWDLIGGAGPDPEISVLIDDAKVGGCRGVSDTTRVVCTIGHDLDLREQTVITLAVSDNDLQGNERIGEVTASQLTRTGRTGVRLPLEARDQVTSAFIELVKIADPPGRWDAHRWRLLGLAGGAGLAMLVMWLFRAGLFRRVAVPAAPVAPDAPWDCRFCAAQNAGADRKCHHCGAKR